VAAPSVRLERRKAPRHVAARVAGYSLPPSIWLLVLFCGPLAMLLWTSFQRRSISGATGFTLDNYSTILTDPTYLTVMWNTVLICSISMALMLVVATPIAYLLAFRVAPRYELLLLLLFVMAGELNPLIRIYAWRTMLGREGVVNSVLQAVGVIDAPIDALLFSRLSVIIVLSTTYIPYTTIPIYAALKAVEPDLLEAANDLGARLTTRFRKLLLPLAAPGIFVAVIIVYIPMFSEFATPALVGGTSGYMIGNAIQEQVLEAGNWGIGSAMSFMLLTLSVIVALAGYRAARIRRLEGNA
jgi:ABC-type spermidine/putrescine transport system permease subunit I